jgi:hypothetical protein
LRDRFSIDADSKHAHPVPPVPNESSMNDAPSPIGASFAFISIDRGVVGISLFRIDTR